MLIQRHFDPVLGGAHRLTACKELGLKEVPANIYRDITPDEAIAISYNNNQNQQTFKPETFLDLAYRIYDWNENEGKTHETIGSILGMSRQNVGYHYSIISGLSPDILTIVENTFATQNLQNVAKSENDDVAENATRVAWQFSWFRHITPLPHRYQHHIIDRVLVNGNKTTTKMVEGWSKLFKRRSVLEQYITDNVSAEHFDSYIASLDSGTYDMQMDDNGNPNDSLKAIIEQLRQESQNRLENIDCLELIPVSDYAAGGRIWDAKLCRGFQSVSAPEKAGGGFEKIPLPDAPDATSTTFGYC